MNHEDHVFLIKKGINKKGGVWADFGSGDGAFTLALRDIAGEDVEIFSVDKNNQRLIFQKEEFNLKFTNSNIHYLNTDFTMDLNLPKLDGIIMANSLHFIKNQDGMLEKVRSYLKPEGRFVLVEYNYSVGNIWVPYPIPFEKLIILAEKAEFKKPVFLEKVNSDFMNEIYSGMTYVK